MWQKSTEQKMLQQRVWPLLPPRSPRMPTARHFREEAARITRFADEGRATRWDGKNGQRLRERVPRRGGPMLPRCHARCDGGRRCDPALVASSVYANSVDFNRGCADKKMFGLLVCIALPRARASTHMRTSCQILLHVRSGFCNATRCAARLRLPISGKCACGCRESAFSPRVQHK